MKKRNCFPTCDKISLSVGLAVDTCPEPISQRGHCAPLDPLCSQKGNSPAGRNLLRIGIPFTLGELDLYFFLLLLLFGNFNPGNLGKTPLDLRPKFLQEAGGQKRQKKNYSFLCKCTNALLPNFTLAGRVGDRFFLAYLEEGRDRRAR